MLTLQRYITLDKVMNNQSFWEAIQRIIAEGFTDKGLQELERYAELFLSEKCFFKRFSPAEQHGCSAGGSTHVVATILSGAENRPDPEDEDLSDFKRELKRASKQAEIIETWARKVGCWLDNADVRLRDRFGERISEGGEAIVYDNGVSLIKTISLDYYILPSLALDRITLHNTYFPETKLSVIAFGRDENNNFKIIVEQPFVEGTQLSEEDIENFALSLGFSLRDKRSWTYSTPYIYLSDLHDENLIKTPQGNICVIDCDIRLNTPDLNLGGLREWTNEVRVAT